MYFPLCSVCSICSPYRQASLPSCCCLLFFLRSAFLITFYPAMHPQYFGREDDGVWEWCKNIWVSGMYNHVQSEFTLKVLYPSNNQERLLLPTAIRTIASQEVCLSVNWATVYMQSRLSFSWFTRYITEEKCVFLVLDECWSGRYAHMLTNLLMVCLLNLGSSQVVGVAGFK